MLRSRTSSPSERRPPETGSWSWGYKVQQSRQTWASLLLPGPPLFLLQPAVLQGARRPAGRGRLKKAQASTRTGKGMHEKAKAPFSCSVLTTPQCNQRSTRRTARERGGPSRPRAASPTPGTTSQTSPCVVKRSVEHTPSRLETGRAGGWCEGPVTWGCGGQPAASQTTARTAEGLRTASGIQPRDSFKPNTRLGAALSLKNAQRGPRRTLCLSRGSWVNHSLLPA